MAACPYDDCVLTEVPLLSRCVSSGPPGHSSTVDDILIGTSGRTPKRSATAGTVLLAAIVSSADFLLTGDMSHFGSCFGREVGGVRVVLPGEYVRSR